MKYFTKTAMQVSFSGHFWERAFGRPRVQQNHAQTKTIFVDFSTVTNQSPCPIT